MIFIFSVNFSGILYAFVLFYIFPRRCRKFYIFRCFCLPNFKARVFRILHIFISFILLFSFCFPIIGLSFLSSTKMTSRSRAKFICSKSQAFPPTENIFRSEGFELQPFSRKSRVLHSRTRLLLRSLLFGWGYVPFTQIRRTTKYLFMIVLPVCMYV